MIDEPQVEKALDYLLSSAEEAAEATAARKHLEEFRKALLAMIASEYNEGSEATRDRLARKDRRYLDHLKGYREAVKLDEIHRNQRLQAQLVIEAWRTAEATRRSIKL